MVRNTSGDYDFTAIKMIQKASTLTPWETALSNYIHTTKKWQ